MFEVVYETRKEGSTPDDGAPPQTSLVLETKFETAAEADEAMQSFQSPFPDKGNDDAKSMRFARDPEEPKWHIWYSRPVS